MSDERFNFSRLKLPDEVALVMKIKMYVLAIINGIFLKAFFSYTDNKNIKQLCCYLKLLL